MQEAAETVLQISSVLAPQSASDLSNGQRASQRLPESASQAFQQCSEAAARPAVCGQGSRSFITSVMGELRCAATSSASSKHPNC